jgi:PAS domain S-box-containing protein
MAQQNTAKGAQSPGESFEQLKARNAVYAAILRDLPYFVLRWRPNGTVRYANQPLLRLLGITRRDLQNGRLWDWIGSQDATFLQQQIAERTPDHPTTSFEFPIHLPDGQVRWLEWHLHVFFDEQARPQQIQAIGEEITQRREAEEAREQAERALRALTEANRAVMRADSEDDLLQAICDTVTRETGYPFTWVGYAQSDPSRSITVMAQSGQAEGLLEEAPLSWDEGPYGQGPVGEALRKGQPAHIDDIVEHAEFAPWWRRAEQKGFRACLALPLRHGERTFGVLSIYASEPHTFQGEETELLQRLAEDLAFGLNRLHDRDRFHEAESARERLAAILDATPDLVGIADPAGNVLYHNDGARRMLNLRPSQTLTQMQVSQSHPDWAADIVLNEGFPAARQYGVWRGETALLGPEGEELPISQTILAHYDDQGQVRYFSTIARDISDQKDVQQRLRRQFFHAVEVFSNLIQLRSEQEASHSRRVAQLANTLAQEMGLDRPTTETLYNAALLHDIGKLGMPDRLFGRPFGMLSSADRRRVMEHPALGEASLMSLEPLDEAAKLIRSHHEYINGTGYPDHLSGDAIPLGARILTVANEFDNLRRGTLFVKRLDPGQALAYMWDHAGTLYDSEVVRALWRALGWGDPLDSEEERAAQGLGLPPRPPHQGLHRPEPEEAAEEDLESLGPATAEGAAAGPAPETAEVAHPHELDTDRLRPNMVLAEDLYSHDGLLLLSAGRVLDDRTIKKLRTFEHRFGLSLRVKVEAEPAEPSQAHG